MYIEIIWVFLDTKTNCTSINLSIMNGTKPDFYNINVSKFVPLKF